MTIFTRNKCGKPFYCFPRTKTFILTLCFSAFFACSVWAQTVTINLKNVPFEKAIADISKKTGYQFLFDAAYLKNAVPVTLNVSNAEFSELMRQLFNGQPFTYEINKKVIIIKSKTLQVNPIQIRGRVIDTTGVPLPGVEVRIKGESAAAKTAMDGSFTITTLNSSPTVVTRSIGFTTKETQLFNVQPASYFTVVMNVGNSNLKEVVVTGYQILSKERSTASIVKVDSATLNQQLNVSLVTALEGRVAGLRLTNGTNDIVMRGPATFLTSSITTYPLIVVDGLPTNYRLEEINPYDVASIYVLKDAAAASIYGSQSANGVIVITTKSGTKNTVSINANADFFVNQKPDINKMHYASTGQIIDYETAKYKSEVQNYANAGAMFNYYGDIGNGTIRYYSPLYQLFRDQYEGRITTDQLNSTLNNWRGNDYIRDYVNNVWQNETRNRYNLSLSSGSAKSNTYVSLNYDENAFRIKYNQSKALNMYFKSAFNVNKWLTATMGLNGQYTMSDATDNSYSDYGLQERYQRIVDGNGNHVLSDYVNLSDGFGNSGNMNGVVASKIKGLADFKPVSFNILDELQNGITQRRALNLRAFTNLGVKFYKDLRYDISFQYEIKNSNTEQFYSADSYKMRYLYDAFTTFNTATGKYEHNVINTGGRFAQSNARSYDYTFRQQLNYDHTFKQGSNEHNITAIGGFEMRETQTPRFLSDTRYSYNPQLLTAQPVDWYTLSNTGVTGYLFGRTTLGSNATKQSIGLIRSISYYGNASYMLNSKYNLTGSVRVDQASFFGLDPKYKWRPIWSAGAGWNVSNEDFMKEVSWLNYLKARVTYGINGNSDVSSFAYAVASLKSDVLFPSVSYPTITTFPNPKLRWETTQTTNLGFDFAVLKNRIKGSIDLYNRYSKDLLSTNELDPTVGTLSRVINNGSMRNRGIELSLSSDWFRTNDWTLGSTIVYAYNKNKVIDVYFTNASATSYVSAPGNYYFANAPYQSIYAYRYAGMTNGYPYYYDQNGKPNVTFDSNGTPTSVVSINTPAALVNMGSVLPIWNGSFSQRIGYKNLQLNVLFIYSGGNKLRKEVVPLSAITSNVMNEGIGTLYTNGNTDVPRLYFEYPNSIKSYASTLSSMWVNGDNQILSADYIKLRNVSLSYALQSSLIKKLHVNTVKLTAQVNNLWYWSAAGKDIDPEAYSLNGGSRSLPIPRSFLVGLNVGF
ncbi:SusC/RagA family TonB-linked outer membrane protein [Mucilaginibacter sp. RS28]|uniref:SusC/RagA family TonB-linked outer membrane protein n=1 Tax=Mucilaginibacter straminoryzae TaxID=2932774 RepID=A0A9X1X0N8_9SPHI|nr:SusC/RagA family TonB-linked outer membrane protein [Mucilaginibacter straminoryzae]MCJ8208989.1 SusC/RagA family TonB-linked outer membrane protein [Mucilaginibacter straminoryzae]